MARQPYAPKSFLADMIHDVALAETQDCGADMVVITGLYGERGVAFFPFDSQGDPEAAVGFSLLGRGVKSQHTNLSRDHAAALVGLLVREYGFDVQTETVTITNVSVR